MRRVIEMGLSRIEVRFFESALQMGLIPSHVHILELGESNLIPAGSTNELLSILSSTVPVSRIAEATQRAAAATASKSLYQQTFGPARAVHHAIFAPLSYTALDLELGPRRFCIDLNGPVTLHRQYDCVINNGTSEHVFDQANVFKIIHEHTRAGGIMVHFTPCLGWANHGLYNVQPGFFFDLAAANGYDILLVTLSSTNVCCQLKTGYDFIDAVRSNPELANAEVCALLRKNVDAPFAIPLQGMYSFQSPALALANMSRRHEPQVRPNLALHRPALQSSTSPWSWHDERAVDAAGGNNGQITGYFGFCTECEYRPWWMVDLETSQKISEIVVYNRLDDVQSALRSAHLCIAISDDRQNWHEVFAREEDFPFGGADGRALRVELTGQSGRYVRVSLPEQGFLHLDEIEVY